ncbi:MAG TPA: ATP-binding protein [Rhizomicrobium sp.]|nr:ATP-binding protein [Rhizomicrobium sp.]
MAERRTEAGAQREQEEKLAHEQLRLALRSLKPNCWLMPILAGVVCLIFARWVSTAVLISWFVLVTVGGSYLGVVAYAFLREEPPPSEYKKWAAHAITGYFIFAMAWSSLAFVLWRPGNDLDQMVILLLIGCTLSGNAALVGASKALTIIGYAIYGFVLVIVPLREGGPIYDGVAAMAFLYVCYLAYMSRQIYSTARDMLLLRDDKNELIDALAHSKVESDRARERAEAASRAKSEFLANMSHELRTPLNAILGFSEMIYSTARGANPAQSAEYAKLVHESGNHLLALVNDILDLARIEAGRIELHETDMDLARLINATTRLMAARAGSAGLTLITDVAGELPLLRADERALRQVLINLLSNAVKFTPAGGEIVTFSRVSNGGDVAFGVRDTGVGIDPGDHLRVFQSFGQGRHDVAIAEKGTGLGLTIVKGLTEAHGGRVELESRPGEGTCVTVIIPSARVLPRFNRAS